MASIICEEVDLPLPRSPSFGIGPMAMTRKPYDDTSDKKLTCSQGELAQAPFPHAIMGSLFFCPKTLISAGLKTVCVGSVVSASIKALYGPVPPSSIVLEVSLSAEAVDCANKRSGKQNM